MNLPISKKTLAIGVTAVSIVAGAVLADTTAPASPTTSPSPSAQVAASGSPTPTPSAAPSSTPSATPQNTPNPNPSLTTVQGELNNHENRITALENATPTPTPTPTPRPTVVSTGACYIDDGGHDQVDHYQVMSDGSTQVDEVSIGGGTPTVPQCPGNSQP